MTKGSEYVKGWRTRTKARLVEAFGGKCGICAYNVCANALDFHHIDPQEKDFTLSAWRLAGGWPKVVQEVRKCVMLCANCHRCVHAGVLTIPEDIRRFDETYAEHARKVQHKQKNSCPICKKPIFDSRKTCSVSCSAKTRTSIDWQSHEILKLVQTAGDHTKAGKLLGISSTAVTKMMSKYHPEYKNPRRHSRVATVA